MPRVSDLDASALIRKWKELVNENVAQQRDVFLLKNFLQGVSPVQVLLGMYRYRGQRTISIPLFLKQQEDWLELDDGVAKIELACYLENVVPAHYYVWKDLEEEENAQAHQQMTEALNFLHNWANRIIL